MDYLKAEAPLIDGIVGLDAAIQELQVLFTNLPWLERSYGRATSSREINALNKVEILPEVYVGQGNYMKLLPNNYLSSHCFFKAEGPINIKDWVPALNNDCSCDISVIFWLNLDKIEERTGNDYEYRYTENLKQEVMQVLRLQGKFVPNRIFDTPEDVYRGYTLNHEEHQTFKHPEAGFKISGTIHFRENCRASLPRFESPKVPTVEPTEGNEV